MKILIVEDNKEKLNIIERKLLEIRGIAENDIISVVDANSAKSLIKSKKFNLLILDINIPKRKGTDSVKFGCTEVLSFIKTNNRAIKPDYIIGMTAYDDIFEKSDEIFSSMIWKVFKFTFDGSGWGSYFKSTLDYLIQNDVPPYKNDGQSYHREVGVICALKEELEALLSVKELSWKETFVAHDANKYYETTLSHEGEFIRIVAAAAPQMGMVTSAIITEKLVHNFRPKIIAMIGICAGIRNKTDLGDILIADPCFEWGGGKWIEQEDGTLGFKSAPYQWRLDGAVKSILKDIGDDNEFLTNLYERAPTKRPENKPMIRVEAMASGSSVLQSSEKLDEITKQHKNLIGIEMESYAVFTASEMADKPKPMCISLKSVCDFGDIKKSDGYHKYACYTSAAVLIEFIKRWF